MKNLPRAREMAEPPVPPVGEDAEVGRLIKFYAFLRRMDAHLGLSDEMVTSLRQMGYTVTRTAGNFIVDWSQPQKALLHSRDIPSARDAKDLTERAVSNKERTEMLEEWSRVVDTVLDATTSWTEVRNVRMEYSTPFADSLKTRGYAVTIRHEADNTATLTVDWSRV